MAKSIKVMWMELSISQQDVGFKHWRAGLAMSGIKVFVVDDPDVQVNVDNILSVGKEIFPFDLQQSKRGVCPMEFQWRKSSFDEHNVWEGYVEVSDQARVFQKTWADPEFFAYCEDGLVQIS